MSGATGRRATVAKLGAALIGALLGLWLGGLVWFLVAIPNHVADPDSVTDAIVVLTGGSQRLESGLALLAAGKAKKLFVSGVHRGVEIPELLRAAHEPAEELACCIVLGHAADNTHGNAAETAAWMRGEGYRSLRLVTAGYHMPRSLLEFSRAMPDTLIVANPVFPDRFKEPLWWLRPGGFVLLVSEYVKFLAAAARPAFLAARPA